MCIYIYILRCATAAISSGSPAQDLLWPVRQHDPERRCRHRGGRQDHHIGQVLHEAGQIPGRIMERRLAKCSHVPDVVLDAFLARPGCGSNGGVQGSAAASAAAAAAARATFAEAMASAAQEAVVVVVCSGAGSGRPKRQQQQQQQQQQQKQKQQQQHTQQV